MSLGFLAPWFLFGALAIGVPLVAHLRRLSVRQRVRFSAMEFLSPMPPRSSKRRWEDVLLMVCRMGLIGLVALAFARPFLREAAPNVGLVRDPERRLVVLWDLSASMRRPGVFEAARKGVERLVAQALEVKELEILGFGVGVRSLVSAEQWRNTVASERVALVREILERVQPAWERTRLDAALRAAADVAVRHPEDRTEVVLISDFREGAQLAGLQGQSWPAGFTVRPQPVKGPVAGDESQEVHLEWHLPDAERSSGEDPVRVRVVASERFSGERVTLHRSGGMEGQWAVLVQPGKGRVVVVPGQVSGGAYVGVGSGEPSLGGVWVGRAVAKPALVGVGGDGNSKEPTWDRAFFLKAAQALGSGRAEVMEMETLLERLDEVPSLWLWSEWPTTEWSGRIRASVELGATAMVTLSKGHDWERLSSELGGALHGKGESVEGAMVLGEIERQHPVFAPFRVGAFSDFSGIRFWRHFRLDADAGRGAKVLASFEGGDPALVEVPVGKGRYLVWASGWKPSEGQFVLSSRCVPFLSGVLEWSTGGRVALQQAFPGERIDLPLGTQRLRRGDGRVVEIGDSEVRVDEPGVYWMEPGGGGVVVNVAPEEKRSGFMEVEKLRVMGVPLERSVENELGRAGSEWRSAAAQRLEEVESRQGGWRKVLWAVVILVGLETFWAARLSRKAERRSA